MISATPIDMVLLSLSAAAAGPHRRLRPCARGAPHISNGMDVVYSSVGDGNLWFDAAAIRYAIAKAGLVPSSCLYDIKVRTFPNEPYVARWSSCSFRPTDGFKRYAVGATIGGNGLSTETAY
jgi:Bacterial HORMA domain 2